MLQDSVARFIATELLPKAEQWERERQIDRASWAKAGQAGLLGASIPEEFGGSGGTLAHEAVIQHELARAGLAGSFGIAHGIHSAIVAHYILSYATPAQKERWLPDMASGRSVAAIAMTEPGAGSDLQAIRTKAVAEGNGYRLNGQKTFISNGQTANLICVVAKTDNAKGTGSMSLLMVEADKVDGFRRGRNLEKLGLHGQDTSELFFDDVFVPADNLLGGEPGQGFGQLMSQLAWERLMIALNAQTNMERAVELTIEYVKDRSVFGGRLMDQQNTQFVLADAKTQAAVGREFVDALMVRLLDGELDATTAAMAKLWTTDTAFRVIDGCQQMFGGYGYMQEYPIARLFADARVARIYGGANEIMKRIIGRSL
ncbi:acyl-CoA dehydrogenase family protein [Sphingobium subterraneum]|uniref:Acyl-CoA dehydrogenase n=1 Tax=Sphingobium subterraneum TaxID=627688 RepID=A0A841J3N5_9SPHN|nr:acyl-CoA dehydrogenase family protein [Sphingobium subterraneum]MBB6125310.1 acyl-CoA dehydrogenase [Sphingobium subterraneum]